jgi:hypothetical protein
MCQEAIDVGHGHLPFWLLARRRRVGFSGFDSSAVIKGRISQET